MANITVKAANGTTDVVYTAMTPSSGDTTNAIWRDEAAGSAAAFKPTLSVNSRYNGDRTGRRLNIVYDRPQTVTDSNGIVTVANRIPISLSVLVPMSCPDTVVAEAIHQATNLFASTLVRDALKSGFAPS
jgi:hypothetical protein